MTFQLKGSDLSSHGAASLGLQRRLLEVAVVVGMDEETGLQCRNQEHIVINDGKNAMFQMHFKAHILDIVSGAQDGADSTLLQGAASTKMESWKTSLRPVNSNLRLKTSKEAMQRSRSVRKLRKRANKGEIVPVSTDFLSNIPYICLPDDSKVHRDNQPPQTHFAVLTDVNGTRHYAVVLIIYRRFYSIKESKSLSWKLARQKLTTDLSNDSSDEVTACYVPLCICLVTNTSYFDVLKRAVSILLKEWKVASSYGIFRKGLQKFVTSLSVVPCPPPNVRIRFSMSGLPFALQPPESPHQQNIVDDMDLSVPLIVFRRNFETLLHILACIMLEQRLVFISRNYSLTTIFIEALLRYITPFAWPHQYVPVLFSEIIDFVACPGIFLMGCHSMHKEKIKEVDNGQILIDLDTGQAFVCASYEWNSYNEKAEIRNLEEKIDWHFPPSKMEKVVKRLDKIPLFETSHLSKPEATSMEEIYKEKMEKKTQLNTKIKEIFMEMMVDLFGNTMCFVDHEVGRFRTDEFMEFLPNSDTPFYLKVIKTYMFKKFMRDRLRRTSDTFSKLTESKLRRPGADSISARRTFGKVRSADLALLGSRPKSAPFVRSSLKHARFLSDTNGAQDETEVDGICTGQSTTGSTEKSTSENAVMLTLPAFPVQGTSFNSTHFYQRCVDNITELMKNIPQSDAVTHSLQASCLLLRGLYGVASGKLIPGLEDLHEIAKEDISQFPSSIIKTLTSSLSEPEFKLIQSQPFYKGDDFYKSTETSSRSEPFYYSDDDLPCNPLDETIFSQIVEKSGVSSDGDVIEILFKALSAQSSSSASVDEQSSSIDPEVFAAFYHSWKQCRHDCETTLRSLFSVGDVSARLFNESERLLKVSSVVSSNRGSGRLILTTDKIIFMTELYEDWKFRARLTQLSEIKLAKSKGFFRSVATTLVLKQDNNEFRVDLKLESELWKAMIEEMKTGRMLSKDWKDHLRTLDVAAQNVCVVDALYQAAKDGEIMNLNSALTWGKKLCNLTSLQKSGVLETLPPDTENLLVLRIDLSPMETKKGSVKCIFFAAAGIDETPRIWVALSSSKIRFIDTTSWKLDTRPIKDWNSDVCTLAMVDQQLWVGAADKNIYVVGCDSLKTTQVLHGHTAPVVAIFSCGNEIGSASSNGEIIVWNKETKKITSSFCIGPDKDLIYASSLNKDTIICGSKYSVSLYTLDGVRAQSLAAEEWTNYSDDTFTCFTCTDSNEIWVGDSGGKVYVWNRKTLGTNGESDEPEASLGDRYNRFVPKISGTIYDGNVKVSVTCLMVTHDGKVWVGNSQGDVTLLQGDSLDQDCTLKAHDAAVTSLCHVENRYVISGSSSKDGKIAVWRHRQLCS